LRGIFMLNPIAVLIDAGRGILMHGRWPNWGALGIVTLIALAMYALATLLLARLTPRYVKLPT
jgi:lipopolysaccharide transport system permease protein